MSRFLRVESQLREAGFKYIAGIDEAGRGPLAGPVVSAAVILKERTQLPGLTDSKLLTKKKRNYLFKLITERAVDFSITAVSHITIDEINIANATRYANQLCVEALTTKPDFVIIDGREKQFIKIPFQTIIKGDLRVKSIAAASILAKVTRDRIMEKYHEEFPKYDFQSHMGYGTRKHRANLTKHGPCEIHRKSYNWTVIKEQ